MYGSFLFIMVKYVYKLCCRVIEYCLLLLKGDGHMGYDIFISYRRDGGEQSAKSIYDRLRDKGYSVFLDVETLRSGAFNDKLYSVIEECKDVIVILSPQALDRCVNEADWMRLEITHALKCKKNVIPIMLRDFKFPEELPQDIEVLRYQNGIQASVEFFDAFLEKLYSFVKSKPGFTKRFLNSLSWRRSLIAVICCVLLISGLWGVSVLFNQKINNKNTYPVSSSQKNDVKNMMYYIQMNLTVLDSMYFTYETALKDCEDYLLNPNASSYQNIVSRLNYTREKLKKLSEQAVPLSKELNEAISKTNIDTADLTALSSRPNASYMQYDDAINFLEYSMDIDKPFGNPERHRTIVINKEVLQLDAQSVFLGTCDLLIPIDESALKNFRTEFLSSLSFISRYIQLWSREEITIESQEKSLETQQQNLLVEYASIMGDVNKKFLFEKEALISLLTHSGMTSEEAEKYVNKSLVDVQSVDNKKKELEILQKELEVQKKLLREKIMPKDTDDPYIVWSKALRFLTVKMYADSIETFQFYMNMVKDTDGEAPVYVPAAINFVKSISSTGIDYGVIVTGYEPKKPQNPFYKVGDIIIAVNKTVCRNFDDYKKIKESIPSDSNFTVTIMRSDNSGELEIIDVNVPSGQNKVAMMNLRELD